MLASWRVFNANLEFLQYIQEEREGKGRGGEGRGAGPHSASMQVKYLLGNTRLSQIVGKTTSNDTMIEFGCV